MMLSRMMAQTVPVRALRLDRIPAGGSSDTATIRTIRLMCEYIRIAALDPLVQRCARYALERFANNSELSSVRAWGVFWYVKHCVKFEPDERIMLQLGLDNEWDLLTNPDLLVRMKNPEEDCDGFSMLAAALLSVLGVPWCLCPVAVDPRRPDEWSHIFLIAQTERGLLPLDTSHGGAPGWMVPLERISRWQCYSPDGRPVDLKPSGWQVHGLTFVGNRRRIRNRVGMGDGEPDLFDAWFGSGSDGGSVSLPFPQGSSGGNQSSQSLPFPWFDGTSAPSAPGGGGGGGSASSGANWDKFWQQLATSGVALTSRIVAPSYQSTVRDPVTGQVYSTTIRNGAATPGAFSAGGVGLSSNTLLIGGGIVAAVLLAMALKGGK